MLFFSIQSLSSTRHTSPPTPGVSPSLHPYLPPSQREKEDRCLVLIFTWLWFSCGQVQPHFSNERVQPLQVIEGHLEMGCFLMLQGRINRNTLPDVSGANLIPDHTIWLVDGRGWEWRTFNRQSQSRAYNEKQIPAHTQTLKSNTMNKTIRKSMQ